MLSNGAPTSTLPPTAATAVPNWLPAAGAGFVIVCRRFPDTSKRYTAPEPGAAVLSDGAPTSTFPPTATIAATAAPKASPDSGFGLCSVCLRPPVVASNTNARPAPGAPTTTFDPATAIAEPKRSFGVGVGFVKVTSRIPRLKTNAAPPGVP